MARCALACDRSCNAQALGGLHVPLAGVARAPIRGACRCVTIVGGNEHPRLITPSGKMYGGLPSGRNAGPDRSKRVQICTDPNNTLTLIPEPGEPCERDVCRESSDTVCVKRKLILC